LYVVNGHEQTDNEKSDYDGIVTDWNYQPIVLPDGKVLIPAKVPPGVACTKVSDTHTAEVSVNQAGGIKVTTTDLISGLSKTNVGEFTGGFNIHPRRRGQVAKSGEDD
jgi:hypothetical protein